MVIWARRASAACQGGFKGPWGSELWATQAYPLVAPLQAISQGPEWTWGKSRGWRGNRASTPS